MINLTYSIIMLSIIFFITFFTYIKMSKNPSAKYYKNKGKSEKKVTIWS